MTGQKYWRVEGYNGTEKFLDVSEPVSHFTESQIEALLQRLVCRSLSEGEILTASKNKRKRTSLLEVSKQNSEGRITFMCGSDPYFSAKTVYR